MRGMMHLVEFLVIRFAIARPGDFWMELDARNRKATIGILLHMPNCFVNIVIKHKLLLTRDREKSEHVTTGKRGDKGFLRINVLWVTKISWRRSRRHAVAPIKAPGMIA